MVSYSRFSKILAIYWYRCESFCLGVLNEGWDLAPMNRANIVLLPNVPSPSNMFNFRPISLCSVIYKIIV